MSDLHVNVGRSSRVSDWFNRSELIGPVTIGSGLSISLKIWIDAAAVTRVVIGAERVTLPNLNSGVFNRHPEPVSDTTDKHRYLAFSLAGFAIDKGKVGVTINWRSLRIKRS